MNVQTKCWTAPASPQWGRKLKVFRPLLKVVGSRNQFSKKFLPLGTQLVEDSDVGVGVVDVVGVRGILMPRPFVRSGHICTICKKVENSNGTTDQCQTWSSQALTRRPRCRIQIRVAGNDGGPGENWGRSLGWKSHSLVTSGLWSPRREAERGT